MLNTDLLEFVKQNAGLTGLVILIVLTILYNMPKLVDTFGYLRSVKIRRLENAMNSEFVDEIDKLFIKEELSKIYFVRSLGVKTNRETKEYALELHKDLRGEFTLLEILRTVGYLPNQPQILSLEVLNNKLYKINKEISLVKRSLFIINFIPIFSVLAILTLIYTAYTTHTFMSYDFIIFSFMSFYSIIYYLYFTFSNKKTMLELKLSKSILKFYILNKEK